MSKKTLRILYILLTVAGIAAMCVCAYQIMVSYVLREYIRLAIFAAVGVVAIEVTGTAIAKLVKRRKKRR